MSELTPDQIDILSEIEDAIDTLTLIANRVKQSRPLGSLLTVKANRLNYLFGRYQLFCELREKVDPPDTSERQETETEEEWLKRIGFENSSEQILRIKKAFDGVKNTFKNTVEASSALRAEGLRPSEIYNLEARLSNDNLEDDWISVDSLANMSASDALKVSRKQHKKWIGIQRERYNSQHDNF